ncbi:DUF6615 family protein [Flavobacterium sp. RNTU_13]|uniref:DUF6615 family protein n=1 Tax=Flavobacterium sp. RNTU_13 TaxID=3375145 RepID=UPI003986F196
MTTLEQALKNASYKVWDELEPIPNGTNYKIFEVREEALTTMAIKELYRSFCPKIEKAVMIPASEESLNGYDFELVIGSKSKSKYVRLFVQAKRLYGKKISSNYKAIDFSQTDALLKYSKDNEGLGTYAFYNHLLERDLNLYDHFNSATLFDKKTMGITICSAYSVKMLNSKKFHDYHFNGGIRISPKLYSLRHFPSLFYFHRETKKHMAVPLHELSYFTIEIAEKINQLYRRIKSQRDKLNFFFFFFPPDLENRFGGSDDLIPVLNQNIESLVASFRQRTIKENDFYNPKALIIIDTDNE